ncbi:hypothetical protein DSO57_1014688 [Entomophthora muscae]|uniref:Uncharacterized protein n=1 Tax=Entomophthora muscae TaxID=34485 RepID=A0ACC2SI47_9FUNG|nr:hypothetical protein DSO57_1014688 [Entomophthora muscae]
MYSTHISSKYAQKVVSQLGVYSLNEEAVCLISALLDTVLILTCEKVKDNPLDILLVKRAIVNLFPPEFSKQILIHSTNASKAVATEVSLIANPVLSNPNRTEFHDSRPATPNLSPSSFESIEPKQLEIELREKCAAYSAMGGKLIKTNKVKHPKISRRTVKQVEAIEEIAVFLNEAIEFVARALIRAATLEAQKSLTPTIEDSHLVAAGQDLNFAMLFSLVSMEDFFMLLPKDKRISVHATKNLGRDRSSFLSDIYDPHFDDSSSLSTLILSSPPKGLVSSMAHKICSAISGRLSRSESRSPSPVDFDEEPEPMAYPKTPHPMADLNNPKCDYEDYHGVELISEPAPPSFVVLDNARWSLVRRVGTKQLNIFSHNLISHQISKLYSLPEKQSRFSCQEHLVMSNKVGIEIMTQRGHIFTV